MTGKIFQSFLKIFSFFHHDLKTFAIFQVIGNAGTSFAVTYTKFSNVSNKTEPMKQTLLFVITALVLNLPHQLFAVSLELRRMGDEISDTVMVGDEFGVELWVDSQNDKISGAAVFISFDPSHFEIIENYAEYSNNSKPFIPGNFLSNGEIFRNYLLDESDPAASIPGTQLDYSIVRASDKGSGPLATFTLRAISPTINSEIKIDETGSRETRFFLPNGNQEYFRYIKPLALQVQGISLNNFPDRVVLQRSETYDIKLVPHFFDPIFPIEEIEWTLSTSDEIKTKIDLENFSLNIIAPQEKSLWQRLIITAKNPADQYTSDTLDVFVNNPPVFEAVQKIKLKEDHNYELDLESIVSDIDTDWKRLEWTSESGSNLNVKFDVNENKATISPEKNWNGIDQISLIATDNFSFSDSLQLEIQVESINDSPFLLFAPNIRLTSGRQDQTIRIEDLIADIEDDYDELILTWAGENNVQLAVEEGSLTIRSETEWYGTEEISLRVEDKDGNYSNGPLTVTVSPSMPPETVDAPSRIFITAGNEQIISLDNWVTDPDDEDKTLIWQVTGNESVNFQINSQHMGLIDSPKEFVGMETLNFQIRDVTGEILVFTVDIYSLPPNGTPLFTLIPELNVPQNGVNTSINLNEYIFDIDDNQSDLSFTVSDHDMVNLRVDPQSHVLIVEASKNAEIETINFQLQVSDPAGNIASQNIVIHVVDTNQNDENNFSLVTIDTLNISKNEIYTLNLEKYIIESSTIVPVNWRVETIQGINTKLVDNILTISSTESFLGQELINIYASRKDEIEQKLQIHLIENPTQVDPTSPILLSPIDLSLSSGIIDSSIFINDLLGDFETNDFTWKITGGNQIQAVISHDNDQIIISTSVDAPNGDQLLLSGKMNDRIMVEVILNINVVPNKNNFLGKSHYSPVVFSDQKEIRIPLEHIVLETDFFIDQINWELFENGNISVIYDSVQTELVFSNRIPWDNNQEFEVKGTVPDGSFTTTTISPEVYDIDSSQGLFDEDFSIIIVPNAFQPEFVDIFVVNQKESLQSPRLRVNHKDWSDIPLQEINKDIWHGTHAVKHGLEGQIQFVASTIGNAQLYQSKYTFELGSILNGRGKLIKNENLSIDINPGAFSSDAVVALLPDDFRETNPGLTLVSPIYNIYSPQKYISNGSRLRMKIPPGTDNDIGLYQYINNKWQWLPSSKIDHTLETELVSLGRFALFSDTTKPKIIQNGNFNWIFEDIGSGLSTLQFFHGDTPLNPAAYDWNGQDFSLYPWLLPEHIKYLQIHVTDNAQNMSILNIQIEANNLPSATMLNQNFPNPFNPSTTIPISISQRIKVRLDIFNTTGQKIRSLVNHVMEPGNYEILWDSRDNLGNSVSSGIYLYQLILPNHTLIKKMTLLR